MTARLAPRRPAPLDANAVRAQWRALAADALAVAGRAVETDGEQRLERFDFGHGLARIDRASFPVADASAAGLAQAFLLQCRALLNATLPRRRAVLAEALLATARAVDAVLDEEPLAAAAEMRRRLGEMD